MSLDVSEFKNEANKNNYKRNDSVKGLQKNKIQTRLVYKNYYDLRSHSAYANSHSLHVFSSMFQCYVWMTVDQRLTTSL